MYTSNMIDDIGARAATVKIREISTLNFLNSISRGINVLLNVAEVRARVATRCCFCPHPVSRAVCPASIRPARLPRSHGGGITADFARDNFLGPLTLLRLSAAAIKQHGGSSAHRVALLSSHGLRKWVTSLRLWRANWTLSKLTQNRSTLYSRKLGIRENITKSQC